METINFILKFFFKLAIGFFFFIFIWWLIGLVYPQASFSSIVSTFRATGTSTDWLPAPKNYASLLKQNSSGVYGTEYVHGEAFDGYNTSPNINANTYSYTYASNTDYRYSDKTKKQDSQVTQSLFIRNLSVYSGGSIRSGLTFVGEARSEFFNQGKFLVLVVDKDGRIVSVSQAVATTQWAVPGWVRFETKIVGLLPKKTPCAIYFEESRLPEEELRQPLRVPLSVLCN